MVVQTGNLSYKGVAIKVTMAATGFKIKHCKTHFLHLFIIIN